jgi:hypothetical protein
MSGDLAHAILVSDIVDIIQTLPRRDHVFAARLVRFFDVTGRLSPRQVAALEAILARARAAQ